MMKNELEIYDIDETLFHTNAKIYVLANGIRKAELTNSQFNSYVLQHNESFDFSEFRESRKFYEESLPIANMIERVKHSLNAGKDIYFVTARDNFDNKELFLETFRNHGIDIDRIRVERAGRIEDIPTGSVRKKIIIRNILKAKEYKTVVFFDDYWDNLKEFYSLQTEFPEIEFQGVLV